MSARVFVGDLVTKALEPLLGLRTKTCVLRPWSGFYLPHPTWMGRVEWFRRHRYAVPQVERAEIQELLLRTYATSRFASLADVLLGHRLTRMPAWRRLRTRARFAAMQWRLNIAQGRPAFAALGASAAIAKSLYVLAEAAMGRGLVASARRLEYPLGQALQERWNDVWIAANAAACEEIRARL